MAFINHLLRGNCLDLLVTLPERSVDLVFADPPYNLQLENELWRPNMTRVDATCKVADTQRSFSSLNF